jgi:rhamnosyltransferase
LTLHGPREPPPRVLVLLATYNGASFVADQIRSIAAQRDVSVRLLASDDGSSDGTVDLVHRIASESQLSAEFLPPHEPSGSSTNNFWLLFHAADFDGCDYVALCDQDDIWLDEKLSCATMVLGDLTDGGYSCNSTAFWPDGSEKKIRKNYAQRRWDYLFESASHGCTYVLTASAARKFQAFVRAHQREFEGIEFHDMLIYAWARSCNMPWRMDDRYLIRYRQTGRNVIGANQGLRAVRLRIQKLREGWFRAQSLNLIRVLGMGDIPIAIWLTNYRLSDRIKLALQARECRRRGRDAFVFLLSCLAGL